MLPSMPILFARDSQDAFGNKVEPSTSFFGQNTFLKPPIEPAPPPPKPPPPKSPQKEVKPRAAAKKKDPAKDVPQKLCTIEKNTAFVKSYYTKVQQRFASNTRVPNQKFMQFQELLKSFDPSKETSIDLYRKMENFFGEEHKDLANEFLQFLSPGQAAEIGRFMDHNMMNKMTAFLQLLHSTFARKPAMLRRILRAVASCAHCASLDEMRAKVLPQLRSSARLAQVFRSLLPDERPPDSLYESGAARVTESFLSRHEPADVWAVEERGDARRRGGGTALDTVYHQGRIFLRHGRLLRPARLAFPFSKEPYRAHARRLAPAHAHPPRSDPAPRRKAAPKAARNPKTQEKKKDVNDNTAVKEKKEKKRANGKTRTPKAKKEAKNAKVKVVTAKVEVKGNSWTREEDKTMLQVLKGEVVSDQVFLRIRDLLPHRSVSEIKQRFFHVMNLLQQMAVGEVT